MTQDVAQVYIRAEDTTAEAWASFSRNAQRATQQVQSVNAMLGVQSAQMRQVGQVSEQAWGQATRSTKELAAAMRGVPAQFTDIITAIQGGQAPLTVLLQQGGQLKDMFGGIGPAARALGGYVAGLVNPFTLAAAAVGTLGYAYYKGAEESKAFNNALAVSGNFAGQSRTSLRELAKGMTETSTVTIGEAKKIATELAASGKVGSVAFAEVARLSDDYARTLGKNADEIAPDLVRLFADPAKGARELNDQMHFLTLAQQEHIESLMRMGQAQEAQLELSKRLKDHLPHVRDELGLLDRAWLALKKDVTDAWDAMEGIGREKTLEDKIKDAEKRVADLKRVAPRLVVGFGNRDQMMAQAQAELDALQLEQFNRGEFAAGQEHAAQQRKNNIEAYEGFRSNSITYRRTLLNDALTKANNFAPENDQQATIQREAIASLKGQLAALLLPSQQIAQQRAFAHAAFAGPLSERAINQAGNQAYLAALGSGDAEDAREQAKKKAIEERKQHTIDLVEQLDRQAAAEGRVAQAQRQSAEAGAVQAAVEKQLEAETTGAIEANKAYALAYRNLQVEANKSLATAIETTRAMEIEAAGRARLADAQKAGAYAVEETNRQLQVEAYARQQLKAPVEAYLAALKTGNEESKATASASIAAASAEVAKYDELTKAILKSSQAQQELQRIQQNDLQIAKLQDEIAAAGSGMFFADQWVKIRDAERQLALRFGENWRENQDAMRQYAQQTQIAYLEGWKQTIDTVDGDFRNSFRHLLDHQEGAWRSFTKGLTNTFKTTVADAIYAMFVKPLVVKAVLSAGNAMGMPGANFADQSMGGLNALSSANSAASMFGGNSMVSSAMGSLGSSAYGAFANSSLGGAMGLSEQVAMTNEITGALETSTVLTESGVALINTLSAAMPYVAAALVIAQATGMFGKRGGPQQGQYGTISSGGYASSFTMSGGDALGNQALAQSIYGQVAGLYAAAGKQMSGVAIEQGYKLDPQGDAPGVAFRTIKVNGRTIRGGTFDGNSGGQWYGGNNDGAGAANFLGTLNADDIRALVDAIADPALSAAVAALDQNFSDLSKSLPQYITAQAAQKALVDSFKTDAERLTDAQKALSDASLPGTVAGWKAMAEGLDLTTQAGQDQLTKMLGLKSALELVSRATETQTQDQTQALRTATDIAAERQRLQDEYDQMTMTSAELVAKERATIDQANLALFDSIQARRGEMAATEAANAARAAAAQQLQATRDSYQSFIDAFYSPAERLTRAFRDLQVAVPDTEEEFRNLVGSLNPTTEAGRATAAALINLLPLWRQVQETASTAATNVLESIRQTSRHGSDLLVQIMQLEGNSAGALALQRQMELDAMDASMRPLQERIYALQDADAAEKERAAGLADVGKALRDSYERELKIKQDLVEQFNSYAESLQKFSGSLALGDLSALDSGTRYDTASSAFNDIATRSLLGDPAAIAGLQQAAQTFLEASREASPSREAYGGDYASAQSVLQRVIGVASGQAGMATASAEQMQRDRVLSFASAGRRPGISIPGFAEGGGASAGLYLAGESGTELIEAPMATRIYPADQTSALLNRLGGSDNDALIEEIRLLREEVRLLKEQSQAGDRAIAQNTMDTAKVLSRWEGGGMPQTRTT